MTKMHELHDPIRSHCFTTIYLLYFWPRLTSCKTVYIHRLVSLVEIC